MEKTVRETGALLTKPPSPPYSTFPYLHPLLPREDRQDEEVHSRPVPPPLYRLEGRGRQDGRVREVTKGRGSTERKVFISLSRRNRKNHLRVRHPRLSLDGPFPSPWTQSYPE